MGNQIRPMKEIISDKRRKLLEDFQSKPLEVGDKVVVPERCIGRTFSKKNITCKVHNISSQTVSVRTMEASSNTLYEISFDDIISKVTYEVGEDPFDRRTNYIRPVQFNLHSISHTLGLIPNQESETYKINGTPVLRCNWNPYVVGSDGKLQHYQRGFVWSLYDKRNLIDSIYMGVDCGKILVRLRSFKELEDLERMGVRELAFHDIVDGKQRLNAIVEFMNGEYTDSKGNYYGDLSKKAQHSFTDSMLFSYSNMPENTPDEEVLYQFLRLNHAGVPQSKEHLDYVRSLMK